MIARKQGRYLVLLLMAAIFLYLVGNSIAKWREKKVENTTKKIIFIVNLLEIFITKYKVGETQSTKSASRMFYPSVTMLPLYALNRVAIQ